MVVGVLLGRPETGRTPQASVLPPPTASETPSPPIVVHVSGQVLSPGLVEVAAESRVADAIAAAGGVTSRADLLVVNLAEPVVDGQQIVVPARGSGGADTGTGAAGGSDSRVRINDADSAALETLPGVGPVLAGAIIAHRDEYGAFRTVEDLLDVPGIGEQKLASLRERVVVP